LKCWSGTLGRCDGAAAPIPAKTAKTLMMQIVYW
jgi:hypothetical protein